MKKFFGLMVLWGLLTGLVVMGRYSKESEPKILGVGTDNKLKQILLTADGRTLWYRYADWDGARWTNFTVWDSTHGGLTTLIPGVTAFTSYSETVTPGGGGDVPTEVPQPTYTPEPVATNTPRPTATPTSCFGVYPWTNNGPTMAYRDGRFGIQIICNGNICWKWNENKGVGGGWVDGNVSNDGAPFNISSNPTWQTVGCFVVPTEVPQPTNTPSGPTNTPRPTNTLRPTNTPTLPCLTCPGGIDFAKYKGNANCDSMIDMSDFAIWYSEMYVDANNGSSRNDWLADFDCSTYVNNIDLSFWLNVCYQPGFGCSLD